MCGTVRTGVTKNAIKNRWRVVKNNMVRSSKPKKKNVVSKKRKANNTKKSGKKAKS